MTSLVATADPVTGSVRIDIEQSIQRDLFTRVVASGWGSATTGGAWSVDGGAASDYSVNGTQGLVSLGTVNVARRTVIDLATPHHAASIQVTIAEATALTAPIRAGLFFRYSSSTDNYFASLSLQTNATMTLQIQKTVLGVAGDVTTELTLPWAHTAGLTWNIAVEICGSALMAKAWPTTVSEPDWVLTGSDFDLQGYTNVGTRSILAAGNTNALPVVLTYDNFVGSIGHDLRLYRVTPDGVSTEVRGSPFDTEPTTAAADTGLATFWDNEAPFNTDIFYEVTSGCAGDVVITSNTVNLDAGVDGWIRDPVDPSRNIRLVLSAHAFDHCDGVPEVALTAWLPRGYANASGVFDIVNNARPNTVSMNRKRFESGFQLASKTLEDVDSIEEIIAPGRILLVSLPTAYGFGRPYGSDYITILDVSQNQINTDDYRDPARSWDIPYRLSNAPADTNEGQTGGNGIGGGDATYEALAASVLGTTYATLAASGETYLQVAQGVGY